MSLFSLLLAFALTQAPVPQPAQAAPLTVMSFNVRYGTANDGDNHWMKRREQLFALLREQPADVVGLQEALHGQIDEILRAVPGYGYVGVGRGDGRQAGEYAAILYKTARLQERRSDTFWFSDLQDADDRTLPRLPLVADQTAAREQEQALGQELHGLPRCAPEDTAMHAVPQVPFRGHYGHRLQEMP